MATVTWINNVWTTTTGNKVLATGTRVLGDMIITATGGSGLVTGTSAVADDQTGGTYTQIAAASIGNAGNNNNHLSFWVRDALCVVTTTHSLTYTRTGDTGGGGSIWIVKGVSFPGSAIIRAAGTASGAAASTPAVTLSLPPTGDNPILCCITQTANTTGIVTPPTSSEGVLYQEAGSEAAYSTPSDNIESCFLVKGERNQTITWGNTTTGAWQAAVVELNLVPMPILPNLPFIHAIDRRSNI